MILTNPNYDYRFDDSKCNACGARCCRGEVWIYLGKKGRNGKD